MLLPVEPSSKSSGLDVCLMSLTGVKAVRKKSKKHFYSIWQLLQAAWAKRKLERFRSNETQHSSEKLSVGNLDFLVLEIPLHCILSMFQTCYGPVQKC